MDTNRIMNLFTRARENALLKIKFRNQTGFDMEKFIEYLSSDEYLSKEEQEVSSTNQKPPVIERLIYFMPE